MVEVALADNEYAECYSVDVADVSWIVCVDKCVYAGVLLDEF